MPTISELEAALAIAREEAKATDKANRAAQSAAWTALMENPDNIEWNVTVVTREQWGSEPAHQGVNVHRRVKPALVKAWRAKGPSTFSSNYQEPGRWFGMFYYRTEEGILTHTDGGHCVLRDPMLCNDAEWQAIVEGNIPAKYKR